MHVLPLRRFVAGTLVFLFPLTALAATRTWDAGGSDNNWSTAANWSDDTVPKGGDIILFDGTGKKNSTVDAAFGGSGAELRIGSSNTGTITVGRSLTVNGNLSLSGGTLAINGGNTVTVKGSWQNGGGTFTAGTGTVVLAGTGSHTLKETASLYNVHINDGLVGYWPLDNGSGLSATDKSGYGNNGTLTNGPTWTTTKPNLNYTNPYAMSFDGTNDYIQVADAPSLRPLSVTLSTYVKIDASENNAAIITKEPTIESSQIGYGFRQRSSNKIWFMIGREGFSVVPIVESSTALSTGIWYHLVGTYDGLTAKLYIDGVLEDTETGVSTIDSTFPLRMALLNCGFDCGEVFSGSIDDVRIYNRALSATEVARLAAGNQPQTTLGTYTLGAALDVDGSLTLAAGTLDVSSSNYAITASGSWRNYGGVLTARSGTVTMDGTDDTIQGGDESFSTLAISSSSGATLAGSFSVSTALTIGAGSTLSLTPYTLTATVASIINSGIITEGAGNIIHTSSLSASPTTLDIGSSISISLTDSDANVDGTAQDTVTVNANGETVTLTETTNTSGIFTGSIATAHGAGVASNGVIENNDACSFFVNVAYSDPQDGTDKATARVTVTDAGVPCEIGGGGGGGGSRTAGPTKATAPPPASHTPSSPTPPPTPPKPASPVSFHDIPASAWFFAAVQELASLGIISGYKDVQGNALNRFGPADPVTFAEALKMTLGVSGADVSPSGVPTDTALRGHWSAAFLSYAQTLGLSLFPTAVTIDQPLSRGKLAQLLVDILGSPSSGDELSFTDVASSHDHAAAIRIAAAQGWMLGDTDANGNLLHRFRPDDSLNRAEVAQVLVRVLR